MIRIPLHDRAGEVRAYALVDDEDAALARVRWSLHSEGYAHRRQGGEHVLLHRVVARLVRGDGLEVDHQNRNRLDCRRENLRVGPRGSNQQNVVANRRSRSRFRGVTWNGRRGRWQAGLQAAGRYVWVGYFDDELAAAIAVNERRRQLMPWSLPDPELVKALAEREMVA